MSNLVRSSKDSQWLQVDVCREHQRSHCPRGEEACKYAHPAPNVEVVDGKVMACYDSCKARCSRPVCKFYHPSLVIMDQLILKGRNHLTVKDASIASISSPEASTAAMISINPYEPQVNIFKSEVGAKRAASDALLENLYQPIYCKRQALEIPLPYIASYQPVFQLPVPAESASVIPLNASFVNYTDANGQLLDNLPVCQDFNRNLCTRVNCKFVHLLDPKKLEIREQRVAVCRDHANAICRRQQCKYYHIPIQLPSATEMASHFTRK